MSLAKSGPAIIWYRNDLRVADNAALLAAGANGRPVVCLYVRDTASPVRARGAAQNWWLHHSLTALDEKLRALGSRLVFKSGPAQAAIKDVIAQTQAASICWNRRYDAAAIPFDSARKAEFKAEGIDVHTFDGQLLHEPTQIETGGGTPFKVFTPFWRTVCAGPEPRLPHPAPLKLIDGSQRLHSERLEDWNLLPTKPDWAGGMREEWTPGEDGAHERLDNFLHGAIDGYAEDRNVPGRLTTSKLSAHLANGEITPFQIWHAASKAKGASGRDIEKFRSEVGWREFAYHLLFHFPKLANDNFNQSFDAFPWGAANPDHLRAWQTGQTGYPIVDAGMRELWVTGWMHNRVRMVVASFLIKHLLIDWREGEKWFWDKLVDACPANNPASWQWVAGSGADAAPYYRIFNPVLQGQKFDGDGAYVRRWVPEIAALPDKFLHAPWAAPLLALKAAGVQLGLTYPKPIVDHDQARQRALLAFQSLKGAA
ncbi:MAG: deoxyribodipyrimidine photo-lyase [Rhizobiaceae bacterium]